MGALRWGVALSVLGGAALFAGCQSPVVLLSRGTYDEYQQIKRRNQEQSVLIAQYISENTNLKLQNAALTKQVGLAESQLRDRQDLIDLLKKAGIVEAPTGDDVAAPSDTTFVPNPYGVGIRMPGDLLFAPGQATLRPEAAKTIKDVAEVINARSNSVAVWGFTDSDPIRVSGWKSNFELSGARALAVLDALKKEGVEPARMHFAGWGEYVLVKPGDKEDKKQSRRVEVVLLDKPPQVQQELPSAARPLPPMTPK